MLLYHLSYRPFIEGLTGLEPATRRSSVEVTLIYGTCERFKMNEQQANGDY